MANDRKVLGIVLTAEGTQEVELAFASLGKDGEAAAKRIKQAFESVNFKGDLTATVKKELADMGKSGEVAAGKINAALAKVGIGDTLTARFVRLQKALAGFSDATKLSQAGFADISRGVNDMVAGVERGIKVFGALSLAVGGVVTAATLLAKSSSDTAEQIQNQADAFGVSFDNMQKLRDAINAVGGDEGLLERALTKFTAAAVGADGATDDLGKKITKFAGVTESGLPGLVQYANSLTSLKTTQEQLAKVSNDFGSKGAVKLLAFLRQLNTGFDDASQSALKLLPALDQLGQGNLADLDQAGDRLATNFSRLSLLVGSRIAPAFTALYDTIREIIGTVGPALAEALGSVANTIAQQITGNKAAIIDFARDATAAFTQFAKDVVDALGSINSSDSSNWIIKLKNDAVGAFNLIRDVVSNVLVPAFKAFGTLLEPVAKSLNAVFGTDFTGNSLAAVTVIAQLTGGFGILKGAIEIAWGSGKVFFDLIFNGKAKVVALIGVVTDLYKLVKGASVALIGLIVANPEIAALVFAVAGLAAAIGLVYLNQSSANDETAKAKIATDEYTAALKQATDGTKESKDALLEKQEALLNLRRESVISAREEKAIADAEVERAQATLGSLANTRAKAAAEQALTQAKNRQAAANATLSAREHALADAQSLAAAGTKSLTDGLKKTTDAANKAAGAVDNLKTITIAGPNGFLKEVKVLPQSILDARTAAQQLKDSLSQPGDNALLDAAQAKAQTFLTTIGQLGDQIQQALIDMSAAASDQLQALADAIPAFFNGVPAALSAVFRGVGSSFVNAWQGAMASIVAQTQQMVASVSGLIAGLRSTLASLTAAIASARARASSSSGGVSGGGARGFAWGGLARGPGTATSDSIPARLSRGEYVLRAAAVSKLPLEFLHALNSARFDFAEVLNRFMGSSMRFAGGGLVQSPRLAFASLSPARGAALAPVTLVFEGEAFSGFQAGADALQRLDKAIKLRRIRSTGRGSPYQR